MNISKNLCVIIFGLSLLFSIAIYSTSLDYYFFQDDFFEINISKASNLGDYLNFYKFRNDIIAYRPISLQNYFFFSQSVFGLNPVGFRFITFTLFILSAALISKVAYQITKNSKMGLLTASFWVFSSIHFMSLTWIAAAYNIIGTFFYLLTTFLFLNFLEKKRGKFLFLSLLSYLVTIGSFEFSVTWPLILGFYCLTIARVKFIKILKIFLPYVVISLIYLALRTFLIKVPQITEYKLAFNIDSIKALIWYFLWTFNIPEEFKKQAFRFIIILRGKFLADYWLLVSVTTISTLGILLLGIIQPALRYLKSKNGIGKKIILFCMVWFLVGIFPVLLLPNHTFTMYLTLSSIGLYMCLSYFLIANSKKFVIFSVLGLFITSSIFTLNFYKSNSWMIYSQKFSQDFAIGIKNSHPFLPSNSAVFYPLQESRNKQSLLFSEALKAVYNDSTLTIYYNKSELIQDARRGVNKQIYFYP